jgi:hypothetical protein
MAVSLELVRVPNAWEGGAVREEIQPLGARDAWIHGLVAGVADGAHWAVDLLAALLGLLGR